MEDHQPENELDDQAATPTAPKGSSSDDRPPSPVDDPVDGAVDDLYFRLNPRQQKAILALVSEPTITKAAETAGVSESTHALPQLRPAASLRD